MGAAKLDPAEIDFFTDPATAADPAAYFDQLLSEHPVWREPRYGVVIVTGYHEALEVYHHPEVYSSINRTGGPASDGSALARPVSETALR